MLSDGEEIMTLAFFVLIQYQRVTDGQTDGWMDGHLCSGYTSACIDCYATALVKIYQENVARTKSLCKLLLLLLKYWRTFPQSKYWGGRVGLSVSPSRIGLGIDAHMFASSAYTPYSKLTPRRSTLPDHQYIFQSRSQGSNVG